MTLQTFTIGKREFVLVAKRDFQRLAEQAQRQSEDDYWTKAALDAESKAKSRNEKSVPFEQIERELDARKNSRGKVRGKDR